MPSEYLVPPQDHGTLSKENRHLANYIPDVWGDTFLAPPPELDTDDIIQLEYEELKEQVRRMLVTSMDYPSQILDLIDAVQHLGVAYHFQREVEDALQIIFLHHCNYVQVDDDEDDLYITSVRFRLLREHGFTIDCDTFNKLKDEEGEFKESLISDVKGMLHLYEAANFQLHGENILEEALSFTNFPLKLAEIKMKRQSQVYHVETKWLHENYIPTMEEYMPIALISCGYPNLTIASLVGMEDNITKETFIWAFNVPKILRASSTVCRLMDDVVTHRFEQERGHVSSVVECYMKQYGASMQAAHDELFKQVIDAWKDMNEEFLKPTAAPTSALSRILNLARVIDLFYTGESAHDLTGDSAKTSISTVLIDSIPI
ncbi:hypothetical protein V6N12_023528 [Hibiscus sabdariffa]|uniref:Terpene synthase N-terminal domain-containing protein n=1 Tax=Hibiscus sabdariffa TaxID=183260 RepID=A0ABR2FYD6_9ROSI